MTWRKRDRDRAIRRAAYHEAGHVVLAWEMGFILHQANIEVLESDQDVIGRVNIEYDRGMANLQKLDELFMADGRFTGKLDHEDMGHVHGLLIHVFGGVVAEHRATRTFAHLGSSLADLTQAKWLADQTTHSEKAAGFLLDYAEETALQMVRKPSIWKKVEVIAAALQDRRSIDGNTIYAHLKEKR